MAAGTAGTHNLVMAQLSRVPIDGEGVPVTASLADRVEVASRSLLALSIKAMAQLDPAISSTQLRALMVLEESGGSNLSAAAAAAAAGVSTSAASRLADRLVAAGLADRQVPTHSRREVLLQLTPTGRSVVSDHEQARREVFAEALADLAETDLQALIQGLDAVRARQVGERHGDPGRA